MNPIESVLAELIAHDSVSTSGNRLLMASLAQRCEDAGARVALQEWGEGVHAKANVVAVLGPDEPDGLVLSGHADVVPFADQPGWLSDPLQLAAAGERLIARGTSDMKGFIAQSLAALPRLDPTKLARPLALIFTSDEEIGCLGAQRLAPELRQLLGKTPAPRLGIVVPAGYRVGLTVRGRDYEYPGGPGAGLGVLGDVFTGVGPFQHNDGRDRPPEIFGRNVTPYNVAPGGSPMFCCPSSRPRGRVQRA